jgi:uncharacterized protein YkwD
MFVPHRRVGTPSRLVHGGEAMTSTAAARVGGLTAALVALLATLALGGTADGAATRGSAYLAPAGACAGAADPHASLAVQRRAVRCLLNWARAQAGQHSLARSSSLQRAAALKGHVVASCGQFSHTPCGADAAGSLRQAGYRYSAFAENLFAGTSGAHSPQDVVSAWLSSEGHRRNILRPGFRHVGAARVNAGGLLGYGSTVLWVAAFASPR